ncbi:unnamed protein product [Fusarium graminearum]|nr:unnamed protein product [Fusarium graminearum]
MASSTFHPFPRLPLELRQQIWREACFLSGPFQRGLQRRPLEACKESREVIIKHTHFEEWIQLQNQAIEEGHGLMGYAADWDSCEAAGHTNAIKEGNQEWHVLLYPAHDIV